MKGKRINMLEQLVGDSQALDRALAGEELSYKYGLELMNYDNLHLLGAVADNARKKLVDDTVTFAASYYMNYTNVCAASCQMCAFYRVQCLSIGVWLFLYHFWSNNILCY